MDMAEVAMDALRNFASSARYTIDNDDDMQDKRSGTADAYVMHEIGLKYSYTLQLRDTGTHGFLLPPTYIDATGRESFEMIKAMIDYLWGNSCSLIYFIHVLFVDKDNIFIGSN